LVVQKTAYTRRITLNEKGWGKLKAVATCKAPSRHPLVMACSKGNGLTRFAVVIIIKKIYNHLEKNYTKAQIKEHTTAQTAMEIRTDENIYGTGVWTTVLSRLQGTSPGVKVKEDFKTRQVGQ